MSSNSAWVTLATNDSYSLGALVLAHSLKTVNTVHKLAILITPGVTASMKLQIESVFDDVKVVDVLDSRDETHLALMSRPELGVTFTKLHCWTLTKYEKCVFLDADTLVLQNCDELFEREELSAAPDPGWPDCFNSGVFVYKPSQSTFSQLLEFARTNGSFDGGDQGLLNLFFKDWAHKDISKHLSFTYNVVWSSTYSYLPALKRFGQNMKIIHFIASSKPWLQSFNTETRLVTATSGGTGLQALLQFWWDLFCHHVYPKLSTEMIESRLSSRYSYDFYPEVTSNTCTSHNNTSFYSPNNNYTSSNNSSSNNFTSDNYHNPIYEPQKEEHYNFVDPWEKYLNVNERKNCEIEKNDINTCYVENSENKVEACLDGIHCEQNLNSCYTDNLVEEQTRDYSFQDNVIEELNTFENEKNINHFGEIREFNEPTQEQKPIIDEHCPACSIDIPINFNSTLSVNNYRPDSPAHYEVLKDQICDSDGGLAGQFARVALGEKTADQKALEDFIRRQSWEQGNMDYLGRDSFSNIWAKINETLGTTPEVKVEPDVPKTPSPPEIVHIEEPKPLKSVLKKSSTTTPPVQSELIDNSELPVQQLEKLDLSNDIVKQSKTPDTHTVISPAQPETPTTLAQEPLKSESVQETRKSETKESSEVAQQESSKPEPMKETSKPDESKKETLKPAEQELVKPKPVQSETSTKEFEEDLPSKLEPSTPKLDEPVKEVSQTVEKTQKSQTSVAPSVSSDPPVAPKRTNKGSSNAQKDVKPSEKK